MNVLLWNLQLLLAIVILLPAFKIVGLDTFTLKRNSGGRMDWVDELQPHTLKLIGGLQILLGIGLFLPPLLNFKPWLTPIAAIGVSLIMMLLLSFNFKRKDNLNRIVINIIISIIALFVAYSRLFVLPI